MTREEKQQALIDDAIVTYRLHQKPRKLKVTWTPELDQDIAAMHLMGCFKKVPIYDDPVDKIMHDIGYEVQPTRWKEELV